MGLHFVPFSVMSMGHKILSRGWIIFSVGDLAHRLNNSRDQ
jgi:hypothetical protein